MSASARDDALPAFGALWFTYFASIGLFNPYAPLWFKELGMSTLAIGAMASLQSWTRIVGPYAWGWLGDRDGRRAELLRWATAAAVAAAVGLLLARGHAVVAMFTAMLFLANGGVVPLAEAALSQHLSQGGTLDFARYGRVRVWGSVGFVLSALVFGGVMEWVGIERFPWFVAAACTALLWAAWRLPVGPAAAPASAGASPAMLAVLRQPAVRWFFGGVFLTVLAHTSLYAFFSLYLVDLGYGSATVGALWGVAVSVEILVFWTQGRWFSRLTPLHWLELAAGLSVLRFGAMAAFGAWGWVLVLTQSLHAFTFAAQHAACIALLNEHFPGALRGRGQALYTMLGYGLSGVLGGVAGGWLSARMGFSAVFWAASGAAALSWLALRQAGRHAHSAAPADPAPT